MQTWLTILAAAGFPTVIAAYIGFRSIKAQLKANQAKSSADTALIRAQENSANIEILKGLIKTLQEEVARSQRAAEQADHAAQTARERAKQAEQRLDDIESDLMDAQEQNELMARQLTEARRRVRDLEQALQTYAQQVDEWWEKELVPRIPTDTEVPPPPRLEALTGGPT